MFKLNRWLWSFLLTLIPLSWWMPVAKAQPQPSLYAPGAVGQMKAPITPPPGFYLENGTLLFFSNEFVDNEGNSTSSELNVIANRTQFIWNTGVKILDGDYFVVAVVPFSNLAPRVSGNQVPAVGIGDIVLQPVGIGWHFQDFHVTASYTLFTPTGRFKAGGQSNTGRGTWSNLFSVGVGYLSPDKLPWNAMVQARYEIPGTQSGTRITPGQALILEYGAGKAVSDTVTLGVVGYATWQTTDQKERGSQVNRNRYQNFGVGPEIQVEVPDWNMTFSGRVYFDYGARNINQGTFGVVSFTFAL